MIDHLTRIQNSIKHLINWISKDWFTTNAPRMTDKVVQLGKNQMKNVAGRKDREYDQPVLAKKLFNECLLI